jgi:hypothetical protein
MTKPSSKLSIPALVVAIILTFTLWSIIQYEIEKPSSAHSIKPCSQ